MFTILGTINVLHRNSINRASIDFSEDFIKLNLWFIKKEYPALFRELSCPRYGAHITLFKEGDHSCTDAKYLNRLSGSLIEVEINPENLTHAYTRRGADMFILQITCPKVLDIVEKAGIKYKFGDNKIHLTICSNKAWRIARGL
jgi:hypothetical protein